MVRSPDNSYVAYSQYLYATYNYKKQINNHNYLITNKLTTLYHF